VKLSAGNSAGYHIVWMKKRTPEHPASLEQDYPRIETLALNFKRNREYLAWLQELRGNIYWESRLQPAVEESHN
jgi:hypothetical protein